MKNKDGFDEFIPKNYNFHDTLKQRLNFADARQQANLYETFKDEDFAQNVWKGGPKDHHNLDSDRATNYQNLHGSSQKYINKKSQGSGQFFSIAKDQPPSMNASTSNFSHSRRQISNFDVGVAFKGLSGSDQSNLLDRNVEIDKRRDERL